MNLKFVQMSLAFLLATYIRLVRRTTRWQFEGLENFNPVQDSGQGFIALVWHSRFMMTPAAWSKMTQKPHILISKSRDGDLVTYASKMLSAGVVRGSRKAKFKDKEKRGAGALREMIDVLNQGDCIVMTPDGPRGPRMHMGEGALRLAKLSGTPVLALAISVSNNKLFNSWDRFMLPLPFGRGKIIFAGPVSVAKDASNEDVESARKKLENMLNQATQKCDTDMGSEVIMPANVDIKGAKT